MNTEKFRLQESREKNIPWKKWGPYLSERQWGTVREDYSENGDAWNFFTHDHARSRAYRWGEDGIAGISDDKQLLCFALALWNGKDAILKERYFGLTNSEGNHGEDVKEYYFYLDSTPTHSYMKTLYKYPQAAYPYDDLVQTNKQRSREEMEYELLDTGIFNENRYFDVFVEYAKGGPEDILVKISAINRGPETSKLHLLPTLWFRNDWSEWIAESNRAAEKPNLHEFKVQSGISSVAATHPKLGEFVFLCEGEVPLLFTENETNHERLFPGIKNESLYVKDGINDYVVYGNQHAVSPDKQGTKAAAHFQLEIGAGQTSVIQLRLTKNHDKEKSNFFGKDFDKIFSDRLSEADEFYKSVTPPSVNKDKANVMRQAIAGMLLSKQYFFFDGNNWLNEHNSNPLHKGYKNARNSEWYHMLNESIISMPDKWEYPWYAAWDLAFHTIPISIVDPDFAKEQMELMLQNAYMHPNGQMPAYEWNFSDVNPPVHAWATLFMHRTDQALKGETDVRFLKTTFNKLMLNFTWWVNRKDRFGKNVFEGGFLGLDNIGIFDRSAQLPTGGSLEQADGTAWMALFSQNMLELAVEIAVHDPNYEPMVFKFAEHFYFIAAAMNRPGDDSMWDEEDGFYYDLLRLPDGSAQRLKVRSLVGLLPLCATTIIEPWQRESVPDAMAYINERLRRMPDLLSTIHPTGPGHLGVADRGILALLNPDRLRKILTKMLDENEFLSPHGIRSISRFHEENPYVLNVQGEEFRVDYLPAESNSGMFGGNSNWRGPIWMPVNAMIVRALLNFYLYYGDNFKIECPTGSGKMMNLFEVSMEISNRLSSIFTQNEEGKRPVYGGMDKFQNDPNWRDYILFYEYFHGDNGAGLGASHQTGWTGLVAKLIQLCELMDARQTLEGGKQSVFINKEDNQKKKMKQSNYPSLYQINTRVWLSELSQNLGRKATLDDIPDDALDWCLDMGFDWIWFLSVWCTGKAGRKVSCENAGWRREFEETLPDLCEDDIGGSGFAITSYTVHPDLGGNESLARLRDRLRKRGLKLMLDFVPNHMGPDHPWVDEQSDFFVPGTPGDREKYPHNYTQVGELIFAHGRDPYFPGWPDTLQLDYGNSATQDAMINELLRIADQCDGVRCDMAMLVLPDVFEKTWGRISLPFWSRAMSTVREKNPGFLFMAEVYWDMEWELQQLGFDYTYDKRLYDRLHERNTNAVREHFYAEPDYQDKLARFLENHDEPRAAFAFETPVHKAAAIITFLCSGLRFFHQGQFEGRKKRISPHLIRGPHELPEAELQLFYSELLHVLKKPIFRNGHWSLLECGQAWNGNESWDSFLAFAWESEDGNALVVVNYAPHASQCYTRLPISKFADQSVRFSDMMGNAQYERNGNELMTKGIYLDMPAWGYHIFEITET